MSDAVLLLGTRKGLITYRRSDNGSWAYHKTQFLGIPDH